MICFVGPLPPPHHGMANVNLMMLDRLNGIARVEVIDIASGVETPGLRAKLRRLARIGAAVPRLCAARLNGARVAYGSVDDGSGGWLTCIWVGVARLLGMRIFLHHHSFRYLFEPNRPVALLARVAGPRSEHIVLCPRMASLMQAHYEVAGKVAIVANTTLVPPAADLPERAPRPFTIGMMSNLNFEKGVGRFLDVLTRLVERGVDVRGVLAGPAMTKDIEAAIESARRLLGDHLEWKGRVSGAQKEEFFGAIDLFVYPTHFDAYPLVVIEALVRGVPVCTTDHGCLNAFAALDTVTIIPKERPFESEAIPAIETLARYGPDALAGLRALARREGVEIVQSNEGAFDDLTARICRAEHA